MSDFVNFLQQLTVADKSTRQAAEQRYEFLKAGEEAGVLPLLLLEVIGSGTVNMDYRQLAAVLLRRLLVEEENSFYFKMETERYSSNLCSSFLYDEILNALTCGF